MQSSSRLAAGSPDTAPPAPGGARASTGPLTYGRGLPALSIATVAAMAIALGLVFFYAPLDAEQGFLQKIFYVHVPLAIVSLCGFVAGGLAALMQLRTTQAARG